MKNRPRHICRGRFFICKAEARPRRGMVRLLAIAAPPDGSPSLSLRVGSCTARATDKRRLPRGSRSAPGSRRLSLIRQIAEFSLPCLGVYPWLRTQVTLTPATFRLPHPRPSARLGDSLAAEKRMPPKHPLRVRALSLKRLGSPRNCCKSNICALVTASAADLTRG